MARISGCKTYTERAILFVAIIFAQIKNVGSTENHSAFWRWHDSFLGAEGADRFAAISRANLSPDELAVQNILSGLIETERLKRNAESYTPYASFESTRETMKNTSLFKFLNHVPKGAVLHVHGGSTLDMNWFVDMAKSDKHAYIYRGSKAGQSPEPLNAPVINGSIFFFNDSFARSGLGGDWVQLIAERAEYLRNNSTQLYDDALYQSLTLSGKNPVSVDDAWIEFNDCFTRSLGLHGYRPLFEKHLQASMGAYADNGYLWMELRVVYSNLVYALDGTAYSTEEAVSIAIDAVKSSETLVNPAARQKASERGGGMLGVKFILCDVKSKSLSEVRSSLELVGGLVGEYPDFVAGYDLVGQEDAGHPLSYFVDVLDNDGFDDNNDTAPAYFFHAGESFNATNYNVEDALALGAKRIGHGYNLRTKPTLWAQIKKRDVCVEVCPISNQVLGLVKDMRNHAGVTMMEAGLPMIISPDDPGIYRYNGTTPDFYLIAVSWPDFDLASLKQLALNSIQYSNMDQQTKIIALQTWNHQWNYFIQSQLDNARFQSLRV